MELTIGQIRESGILEQYVLGKLNQDEADNLRTYLLAYPELKSDIREIESALFHYADAYKITPPSGILQNIKKQLNFSDPNPSLNSNNEKSNFDKILTPLLLALAVGLSLFLFINKNKLQKTLEEKNALIKECEENNRENTLQLATLEHLNNPETQVVNIEATPNYPETQIVIYVNDSNKKNILYLNNLPQLAANESFQLWSLGAEGAPKPMDVFDSLDSKFLNSGYIDATAAYAITIEKKGGSESPNLEKLIGVFKLS